MITENNLPLPKREIFTMGDIARREEMARLRNFVTANCGNLPDDAHCAGNPDWSDAKGSLFAHSGVAYAIQTIAVNAALEKFGLLDMFEFLRPDDYLTELNTELAQASDGATKERLAAKTETFIRDNQFFPDHLSAAKEHAKAQAAEGARSLRLTFQLCKRVLNDWLSIIPAKNFRELLNEIERIEHAPVAEQMKFFGLADLIPLEDK